MEQAQQICVEHTKKIFGGKIGLMFYDMTTLYFETFRTGVMRELDFSKDEKTANHKLYSDCSFMKKATHCYILCSTGVNMMVSP